MIISTIRVMTVDVMTMKNAIRLNQRMGASRDGGALTFDETEEGDENGVKSFDSVLVAGVLTASVVVNSL